MGWKHSGSQVTNKFKIQTSAGKVMLTFICDQKGPILEDYLEQGHTIDSARYSDLLASKLKPAIRTKRRGLLSNTVLLLHDNAHPHTAAHILQNINQLGLEVLEHPP